MTAFFDSRRQMGVLAAATTGSVLSTTATVHSVFGTFLVPLSDEFGWTRERAIDYMLANSGMGRTDAEAEVDRYVAIPAQALSYKIGSLTIQRLRRQHGIGSRWVA